MKNIVLREVIKENLQKNHLSLSQFSKLAKVDKSIVSRFLRGERSVTLDVARKLISILPKDKVSENLIELFVNKNQQIEMKIPQNKTFLSKWYILAVWSLLQTKNGQLNNNEISLRLNISDSEVNYAISILENLNLVIPYGEYYKVLCDTITTQDNIPSCEIKNFHKQQLDLAKKVIDELDVSRRDFSSITIPANPKLIEEARKIVRKMHDDIEKLLTTSNTSEVFVVNVQMFPLTRSEKL